MCSLFVGTETINEHICVVHKSRNIIFTAMLAQYQTVIGQSRDDILLSHLILVTLETRNILCVGLSEENKQKAQFSDVSGW